MNNSGLQLAKYGLVGLIWVGVLLLGIFIAIGSGSGDVQTTIVAMGIAGFVTAAVATGFVLADKDTEQQIVPPTVKAKNDTRSADPMSLLTDDDIAELRAEMKDQLRRRMLEGDEETSFEALLSDASAQRKRR